MRLDIGACHANMAGMSLPPGFLDELRTRTSLAQVAGRKVVWDQRKSNQGKGDMWAPCPFHQEKTASFHVDDKQGFYYCFGCHAKGDAISFVRETENMGFMEAVELLAREAGMDMPARDPRAQEKADRRSRLADVMEAAVQYYRLQLKTAAGARARDYIAGRGLGEAAIKRWEIGFAPDARQGLFVHLSEKGIGRDLIVAAGLAAEPEDGGAPYDRFRGRIIFPIRDARGRAIAFGGRALSASARAKYLNSPQTELFDKGHTLFNIAPAREAAGKDDMLIVAEGYMDVIALVEAGFGATVAPLGTAITEHQLAMLWRLHPEPVIALDGDKAGLGAAMRLVDLALPMLEAGKSLRFALMPEGQDPDDLIRSQGAAAMRQQLEKALPMVQLLWRRETEGKVFDSPERKAALDKSLRDALRRIRDRSIRAHYGEEIKALRQALFSSGRPAREWRGSAGRWRGRSGGRAAPVPAMPLPGTRSSYLATAAGAAQERLREAAILAVLVANPEILPDFLGDLETLEFTVPEHRDIQAALLNAGSSKPQDMRALMEEKMGAGALEKLFSLRHVKIIPAVLRPGDKVAASLCVAQELAKLAAFRGAEREIEEAARDLEALADEGVTWRLGQAAQARNDALRSNAEDAEDFERAENGAEVNRAEKDAFDDLLKRIDFTKARKRPQ